MHAVAAALVVLLVYDPCASRSSRRSPKCSFVSATTSTKTSSPCVDAWHTCSRSSTCPASSWTNSSAHAVSPTPPYLGRHRHARLSSRRTPRPYSALASSSPRRGPYSTRCANIRPWPSRPWSAKRAELRAPARIARPRPSTRSWQTLEAMQASVCVAIASEREIYGFLCVRDERLRDAFAPEEVQLLVGLANQMVTAIENSRLYQRMKERDRLAAMGEMAAGLAHEIRNPLGAIKASAQYSERGTPGRRERTRVPGHHRGRGRSPESRGHLFPRLRQPCPRGALLALPGECRRGTHGPGAGCRRRSSSTSCARSCSRPTCPPCASMPSDYDRC